MSNSIRQATHAEFLAAMIDIHGGCATHPIDGDDDPGTIVWFTTSEVASRVATRLGPMAELFDGNAIYIHAQFVSGLFPNHGA